MPFELTSFMVGDHATVEALDERRSMPYDPAALGMAAFKITRKIAREDIQFHDRDFTEHQNRIECAVNCDGLPL